jgi:hypothetical protein
LQILRRNMNLRELSHQGIDERNNHFLLPPLRATQTHYTNEHLNQESTAPAFPEEPEDEVTSDGSAILCYFKCTAIITCEPLYSNHAKNIHFSCENFLRTLTSGHASEQNESCFIDDEGNEQEEERMSKVSFIVNEGSTCLLKHMDSGEIMTLIELVFCLSFNLSDSFILCSIVCCGCFFLIFSVISLF